MSPILIKERLPFWAEKKSGQIRRDIRIRAGARNASGVEVIGQDDKTKDEKGNMLGNRCQ